jgi:hypothetical protein
MVCDDSSVSDAVPVLALVAIGCLIVVGSSRLGHETSMALSGLWAPQGRTDWPHGVQEMDAPSFEVAHLDALQPGTPMVLIAAAADGSAELDEPMPEMIELFDRPLRDDLAG